MKLPEWFQAFIKDHKLVLDPKASSSWSQSYVVQDHNSTLTVAMHKLAQAQGFKFEGRRYTNRNGWHKNYMSDATPLNGPWIQVERNTLWMTTQITYFHGSK